MNTHIDTAAEAKLVDSFIEMPRIVIVLNERIDTGRLLNAASHLALGFGASCDPATRDALHLLTFEDAFGTPHSNISALSLVVLKANASQLRTLKTRALESGLTSIDFLDSMTGGTYLEQLDRTKTQAPDTLTYWGLLLFGTRKQLDPLTRKFSLFRD